MIADKFSLTCGTTLIAICPSAEDALEMAQGYCGEHFEDLVLWHGSALLAVIQVGGVVRVMQAPTYADAASQADDGPMVDFDFLAREHERPSS